MLGTRKMPLKSLRLFPAETGVHVSCLYMCNLDICDSTKILSASITSIYKSDPSIHTRVMRDELRRQRFFTKKNFALK